MKRCVYCGQKECPRTKSLKNQCPLFEQDYAEDFYKQTTAEIDEWLESSYHSNEPSDY